jgi:rfaE bifunctional protein kinase chain/domain
VLLVPEEFCQHRVVVVGDAMLDTTIRSDSAYWHPGERALIISTYRQEQFPGGAANIAANISSLGGTAIHLGVVGDDEDAAHLRAALTGAGVQPMLVVDPTRPTTRKLRVYHDAHLIIRVDSESTDPVGEGIGLTLLTGGLAGPDEASALVLSDYGKGAVTASLARGLLAKARSLGMPTIVDSKSRSIRHFEGCAIFKANRHELEALLRCELSSDRDRVAAAGSVSSVLAGATVVVTDGERGITYVDADGSYRHVAPPPGGTVKSVVGAGDTVTACLALARAAGMSMTEAVDLALHAAAEAVVHADTTAVRGHVAR